MVVGMYMGGLLLLFGLAFVSVQHFRGDKLGFVDAPRSARKVQAKVDVAGDSSTAVVPAVSKISGGYEYHIVFSTGCSLYQDWQSYVFFHRVMTIGQAGTVTRIVSGCDDKESEAKMIDIFNEQIRPMAPDRFKIHVTPDFSLLDNGKHFVYFNKPFGMKHWLENALGFPKNPINKDAIVILVDPDQLFLRPFRNNDFTNTNWAFIKKGKQPYTKIEHGRPMGQLYGFGLQWRDKVNMTAIAPNSPADKLTRDEARTGYVVGYVDYTCACKIHSSNFEVHPTLQLPRTCTRSCRHGAHLRAPFMHNTHSYWQKCLHIALVLPTQSYPIRRLGRL